jgi:hypothetical protein
VTGGGKETQNLEKNIRQYNKTGTFGQPQAIFNPGDELNNNYQSQSPNNINMQYGGGSATAGNSPTAAAHQHSSPFHAVNRESYL